MFIGFHQLLRSSVEWSTRYAKADFVLGRFRTVLDEMRLSNWAPGKPFEQELINAC